MERYDESSLRVAMVTERSKSVEDDLRILGSASRSLATHVGTMVAASFASAGILQWLATIAAIYLLILDKTNWRTNMLTSLLVPYIFLNLPSLIFNFLRGDVGKWVTFIAVVIWLFIPRHFPEWLELPGALILLIVIAPSFLSSYLRSSILGVIISLFIGAYLLQQHIRAAGGFRKAFAETHGVRNTVGILLLFVSPLWDVVKYFL